MFPAQALAENMSRAGWRVRLATDERGERYSGGFPNSTEFERVASATFSGGWLSKTVAPVRIISGILTAYLGLRRDPPDAVIGFGGYPAVPVMAAAVWLGLPRMIHEQNGVFGRANRFFARRMDFVACGIWSEDMPPGTKGIHTGNPVRDAIAGRAKAPYIPPGDYPMEILVIGGSQGARTLSRTAPPAIASLQPSLRSNIRVSHQAREEDLTYVRDHYADHGIKADVQRFFDDVHNRMAEAQLVISRAGASAIAELSVIGRPSILIPYPHAAADHQTSNAKMLVDAGGAMLLTESELSEAGLSERIGMILGDPDKAAKMAEAALATGRPDALDRLSELVMKLAERK